jgi:hypothetical protein
LVDQCGVAVLAAVYLPDGSRLRDFPGSRDGKRTFAVIADTAGTYRLNWRGTLADELIALIGAGSSRSPSQ